MKRLSVTCPPIDAWRFLQLETVNDRQSTVSYDGFKRLAIDTWPGHVTVNLAQLFLLKGFNLQDWKMKTTVSWKHITMSCLTVPSWVFLRYRNSSFFLSLPCVSISLEAVVLLSKLMKGQDTHNGTTGRDTTSYKKISSGYVTVARRFLL